MTSMRTFLSVAVLFALTGCWDEELPETTIDGTVVVPGDLAATPADIGMVYVGVFEAFDPFQLGYPYPSTGPRVGDAPIGDALPYGGTTIGSYAYGCYRALACEIITGRYATLADVLEANPVELEVEGTADVVPATEENLYDQCTWYYGWNSIQEFTFVGSEQLDFAKNSDGDWEASFRAWRTQLPAGAILWGFVDNDFTTCTTTNGSVNRRQSEDGIFFREGTNFGDVLNLPDKYITAGDWIVENPDTIEEGRSDGYRIVMDYVKD
jgi:hypothetical protein